MNSENGPARAIPKGLIGPDGRIRASRTGRRAAVPMPGPEPSEGALENKIEPIAVAHQSTIEEHELHVSKRQAKQVVSAWMGDEERVKAFTQDGYCCLSIFPLAEDWIVFAGHTWWEALRMVQSELLKRGIIDLPAPPPNQGAA